MTVLIFFIQKPKLIALLIFAALSAVCCFIYNDYGASWDENSQIQIGEHAYNCIVHGKKAEYDAFSNKYYGNAFEFPITLIQKDVLGIRDTGDIYRIRHLLTSLFFCFSCAVFYLLLLRIVQSQLFALIGTSFLFLSPVIFGHAFINSKDVPFLGMTIICIYLSVIAFGKRKISWYVLLGASLGLLINIRILGVILAALIAFLFLIDLIQEKGKRARVIRDGAIVFLTCTLTLYATWPLLWSHPVYNFLWAFKMMKQHIWDGTTLYFGELLKGADVPWHYGFVWMGITTPVIYFLLFFAGLFPLGRMFLRRSHLRMVDQDFRIAVLLAGIFLGPLAAVVLFDSVLYDGWRQLYFIYAGFLPIAVMGLKFIHDLFRSEWMRKVLLSLVFLCAGYIAYLMIHLHPYQHVYFNRLVSHDDEYLRKNFEMDYWITSYREAYEFIAEREKGEVRLSQPYPHPFISLHMLNEQDRSRMIPLQPLEQADYFITGYRQHPEDYPFSKEVFYIERNGSRILSVFTIDSVEAVNGKNINVILND